MYIVNARETTKHKINKIALFEISENWKKIKYILSVLKKEEKQSLPSLPPFGIKEEREKVGKNVVG